MSPSVHVTDRYAESPHGAEARFVVGQDPQGHWVAVEVHGWAGGLFRSRGDAVHFAVHETQRRPDAVSLSADLIELRL